MKALFIHLSLAISCSYFYASDRLESIVLDNQYILLQATQEELDAIHQNLQKQVLHADRAIATLHSVLPEADVHLVIDYLRPEASHHRYHRFMCDITGIMASSDTKDTIDVTISRIEKKPTDTYSISRAKIMYHYIMDTFTHKPLSPAGSICSGQQTIAKLDNQKSVPPVVLPNGTTLNAFGRFLSVDNNNDHLALAHTQWLSSQTAYTKWLSRINNKSLVKSLKWNEQQT